MIQQALDREVSRLRVPGIQPSGRVGPLTESAASGYKDLKRHAPLGTGDILRIGGVTTTVTSGVILKLAERGLVNLDDPARRWFGLRAGAAAARHRRQPAVGPHRNHSRVRRRGGLLAEDQCPAWADFRASSPGERWPLRHPSASGP